MSADRGVSGLQCTVAVGLAARETGGRTTVRVYCVCCAVKTRANTDVILIYIYIVIFYLEHHKCDYFAIFLQIQIYCLNNRAH